MAIVSNIKSLQGMGIYADRGARSPSLKFRRYNLVYGFNGSGKSTLSRLFASLEAGRLHPKLPTDGTFEIALDDGSVLGCPINPVGLEKRLLVFNSDYIEQNLQWAAGRANPVFYIGADQAEAANELTKVEGDIIQADAKREAASVTEKAAERTFANFKRERAKSVASRLHLGNRKYEAPALAKDYDIWKDDYGPALTDDELKAAEDTCRLEEPMPRLETISFDKSTIETAYRFIADVCGQSLATVALDEVKQYPDILLWLKHGHEYHEAHGIADCLLCGNAISAERRALLAAALDDTVDQFVARLNKTAERLSGLIESSIHLGTRIPALDDLATELRVGFREVRENLSQDVRLLAKQLGTLQVVLSAKLERPATPADMKDVAVEADVFATAERLDAGVAIVNEAITAHNQAVTDFAKHKESAEDSIRRHFIIDCRDDYAKTAKDLYDAMCQFEVEANNALALRDKANELRQQIRTHGPAAGVINKLIAAYLGHGEC